MDTALHPFSNRDSVIICLYTTLLMLQLMKKKYTYILVMQRFRVVYPWKISLVTCIFWYTHEPLGECLYQENTSDEADNPWLYHEKVLHNHFISCRRKYSGYQGKHNQCEIREDLNAFEMAS